jgi:hypothetical protein
MLNNYQLKSFYLYNLVIETKKVSFMNFQSNKYLLVLIFLFFSSNIFSQNNYYSGTYGINGPNLKSVLHSKIRNHIRFPYTSSSIDVWDLYP